MKKNLPVMLLKGTVLLPFQDVRLDLNSDVSSKVIDLAMQKHTSNILIVCPKNPFEESPDISDLPSVGVVGKIKSKLDLQNGNIRIVAGDASYPYGSIVRVKGSKLGEFYAIVLDRGGAIGKGKRFMFDLLFPSNSVASQFGTEYNLTFEILRYGY